MKKTVNKMTQKSVITVLGVVSFLVASNFGQAQWLYTTNNAAITITGYTGPGGAVAIPSVINTLPVARIGDWAFYNGTNLTSITIPTSVTSIGYSAFYGCRGLTSVAIPSSVITIRDQAFYDCRALTSVMIPASVTSIGDSVFEECRGLTAITVAAQNQFYSSLNGVLFNQSQTTLLQFPGGVGGSYTIPGSVTTLGAAAFANCRVLTSVTIPTSVTRIETGAFAFCEDLGGITVPSSVTYIGLDAFYQCFNLTAITVDAQNQFFSSVNGVLFNKNQTTLCTFPRGTGGAVGTYTIPAGVTNIGADAFAYCTGLTSITIPSSVTSLEFGAFFACSGLTSLTIPSSVTSIGGEAFFACNRLKDITIPTGVPSLGSWTFRYCYGLTNITIAATVTNIGSSAFDSCTNLTSVTIPSSVTSIRDHAFSNCKTLTEMYVLGHAPNAGPGLFDGNTEMTAVYYFPGTSGWGPTYAGIPTVMLSSSPPIIDVSGDLGFGSVSVGMTATRPLTISNNGNAELTVSSITYPAGYGGDWSGSIAVGGSTNFMVTFTPVAATSYHGTIIVNSDAPGGANTVAASGTGQPAATTRIIGVSGSLAFDNVVTGTTTTQTLTIANSGNTALSVSSIHYPTGFSGAWSGSVPPDGSQPVTVTFTPTSLLSYGGTLTVASDATGGLNTLSVSGTGVVGSVEMGMTVTGAKAKVNFAKGDADSFAMKGTVDLPAGIDVSGQAVILNVGGAELSFTLDTKGKGRNDNGGMTLANKNGVWNLSAQFKSGTWADEWEDDGFVNAEVTGATVTLPISLQVGGGTISGQRTMTYKAKAGKSGSAR